MPVITGAEEYPEDALDKLSAEGIEVISLDALSLSNLAGSPKAVNIVLMGRLSKYMSIDEDKWLDAIKASVAEKFCQMNTKAFLLGRE